MADVDRCTREAEWGLVEFPSKHAAVIACIPNAQRVLFFRNKSSKQIESDLVLLSNEIVDTIQQEFAPVANHIVLQNASSNNREGADLFCDLDDGSRLDIEVKFGAKTDHAIGMDAFEQIFGTKAFTETASLNRRKIWKALYAKEYP